VYDPQSPEADLVALGTKFADVRRLALVRLWQRELLLLPKVRAAVRWRTEDADPEVRRVAFLVSLFGRPRLVTALRQQDPELHRQLVEMETGGKEGEPAAARKSKKGKDATALEEGDDEPILQATASRALDTSLRGARTLAMLGDARAFGLLLQLSREEQASARVEVCRALAALDDPRGVKRLRSLLFDPDAAVRDAAFTALAHLHSTDPLSAAESGLNAAAEDVRRRGLQVLLSAVRKGPPKDAGERSWQLLVRALNDNFEGVRNEAFKAALNQQIAGGGIQTLRFVLQSIHEGVRREVLTEVMAQAQEPWAWHLLLEFFNDPEPRLRDEAFAFAIKKNKELPPLEAALRSQYADLRRLAVDGLIKKHTPQAQALLVQVLRDPEKEVRLKALETLVGEDAQDALREALKNPHDDVRVRAAAALARQGAKKALAPLLTLATQPEPQEKERQTDWQNVVSAALGGLAELADPAAQPQLYPLLDSKHAALRKAAAQALTWISLPHYADVLRQTLQHGDPQVKYQAALGLAVAGDPMVAGLIFSAEAAKVIAPEDRLVAALTLGPAGEDQLVVFLDDNDETIRNRALLLLMLLELEALAGMPARCLAALSSRVPRVRLTAARGVESFSDPATFLQFVAQLFNDRGDEPGWKIPSQTVADVAELIAHGSMLARARTAMLLRTLAEKEQAAWDLAWSVLARRFAREIAELRERKRPVVERQSGLSQLQQLAFGAYVGLVREQAGTHGHRIRQTALARLLAIARADANFEKAAVPVFVQALGDPIQAVRMQAFEQLRALGMDSAALGAEALEAGHTDLGVRGLELLTDAASAEQGQLVLEQVMLTRKDQLATEAALLLMKQRGQVPVAKLALDVAHEELRNHGVYWLAGEYDRDDTAKQHLHAALESRYRQVRHRAAFALAEKKDAAAFGALQGFLKDPQTPRNLQLAVIQELVKLGDARGPGALLDRLENDPSGTAPADEVINAAGQFRRPQPADRLLAILDKKNWRNNAFNALLQISGYDQSINDLNDELPDRSWLEKQFPRHDAVLARLAERCLHLGEIQLLYRLFPGIRWAPGKEVDPVLALFILHSDQRLRNTAVEALGWRLRKRGADAQPVVRTLQHGDPTTQILAAEGLARAGRAEGINVLLSAVDFLSDLALRRRAVHALGELADARSLDTLLKLASEDGHALQDEAAEAIGHLGKSPRADDIFKLLARYAKQNTSVAARALTGLRWFNTRAGWLLVRERTEDFSFPSRQVAAQLLGYNDDHSTRELLLRLIREDGNWQVVQAAFQSARRLFGADSLEPEYAFLQNQRARIDALLRDSLDRVSERGEPDRNFEIMPRCAAETQERLAVALLHRPLPPVEEAQAALASPEERTVQVAAQIMGRAVAPRAGPAVENALKKWWGVWQERLHKSARANFADETLATRVGPCVQSLIWAAGRLGVAQDVLLAIANTDRPIARPLRREAVTALANGKPTKPVLELFRSAAVGDDAEIRTAAAVTLARHQPAQVAPLAERLLHDRTSFDRVAAVDDSQLRPILKQAAAQVHLQGVALPHLIAQGDIYGLGAVAGNRSLPEATRLGAVEALAKLAREPVEEKLRQIGLAEGEEEEIRKAAWRALRRSKRARQREKAQVQP
jgi:ParB family chromosome partitioning protein